MKWTTQTRKINDLIPYPNNPRQMTDKQVKDLTKSLEKFDLVEIPAINTDGTILAGHQRLKIMQLLGRGDEEIDVRVPDRELNEQEVREYNIRSNRNTGEWDWDLLANNFELDDLLEWGFDEKELHIGIDEKDNEIPEIPTETDIKIGDKYKLGEHILVCGNSREYSSFYQTMKAEEKAKLVFTSPPYNIGGGMYKNYRDNLESKDYIDFNLEVIRNCQEFLSGFLFWNISYNKKSRWEFIEIFYKIIKEVGLKFLELIVWDKGHGMPITSKEMVTRQYENILLVGDEENIKQDLDYYFCGSNKTAYFNKKTGKGITNYWKIGTNKTQIDNNKACFPVELPLKAIEMMTNIGDIVLEPFAGSGSTMIACEKSERKCRMIEIDPILCQLIINRYQEYTNKKAEKINE